ncbi:MAG: ATPase domain-containing protein [Candidatus Micrarchaeota archaeon]
MKEISIQRTPSGIPGLDTVTNGGFIKNSVILVRGGTGTCKTTMATQFLVNGSKEVDENSAFISFSETKESVYATAKGFGWDLDKLEKQGKFAFIKYSPYEVEKVVAEGGGTIRDTIEEIGAKRLVIDSLTAYSLLFQNEYRATESILQLFDTLKSWDCTVLVTDEIEVRPQSVSAGRLGFLTDGIMNTYYLRSGNGRVRALEVLKMRYSTHSDKIVPFEINSKGISVYPNKKITLPLITR